MSGWDIEGVANPESSDDEGKTNQGKEWYTFVVSWDKAHPRQLLPHKIVRDGKGKPRQSAFNKKEPMTEPVDMDVLQSVRSPKIFKWAAKKDILEKMTPISRSTSNALKIWLNKTQSGIWFHNGHTNECSMYPNPHFHVITQSEQTSNGSWRRLYSITAIKTIKKRAMEAGGYFRTQAVRNLSALVNYMKQPPRIYMGTNSGAIAKIWMTPTPTAEELKYADVTEEIEEEDDEGCGDRDWTGFEEDLPSTEQAKGDGWSDDELELQPAKKMKVCHTQADHMMRVLKILMLKYSAYNVSDMWKRLGEATDGPEKSKHLEVWKRMIAKPRCSGIMTNVKQELESEWITKPFLQCIKWYCTHVTEDKTKYFSPERSYYLFTEWCALQDIDPGSFAQNVFDLMERFKPKLNTILILGESNAGKTVFVSNPLRLLARFVGQIGNRAANGNFLFSELPNKRLIIMDECVWAPEQMEDMKNLLGGEVMKTDKKYSDLVDIERTPVLLTGNKPPWVLDATAKAPLENRCLAIYRCHALNQLKDVKKQLSPKMWHYLLQIKPLLPPPAFEDLIQIDEDVDDFLPTREDIDGLSS